MIDLHSHFLPGIDDGASDLAMTEAMLQNAVDSGITHLLATPHVNEHTSKEVAAQIRETFEKIKSFILDKKINLHINLGAEINYNSDLKTWSEKDWIFIDKKRIYLLVELPMYEIPPGISESIFNLGLKKIKLIIAHPERNVKLKEKPEILVNWVRQGSYVQLDAGSIIGQFGRSCKKFSEELIKAGIVHYVGSDAHDPSQRNYTVLKNAYELIKSKYGSEYAHLFFFKNPENVLKGNKIKSIEIKEEILDEKYFHKILRYLKNIR